MPIEIANGAAAENFAQTIANEARSPEASEIAGRPFVFVPEGYRTENYTALLPRPPRKTGVVYLDDADSFVAYVTRHQTDDTAIYCSADLAKSEVSLTAVINDHGRNEAGWGDHRAMYLVAKSEEWKRWTKTNMEARSQAEFALFIEDNQKDIASVAGFPTGAEMLQMALSLEINQDARFKSSIRLQSGGVEMTLVDQEDDATLKRMQVFERFAIGITPFLNGDAYQLTARLRYRAQEGKLRFWYELIRPDLVMQAAVKELVQKIGAATGLLVLLGRVG
jgi:uncharacterized protein YfdQ (DUF2303 family)